MNKRLIVTHLTRTIPPLDFQLIRERTNEGRIAMKVRGINDKQGRGSEEDK